MPGQNAFQPSELNRTLAMQLIAELIRDSYVSGTTISVAIALMFEPTASAETLAQRLSLGLETVRASLRILSDRSYLLRYMIHRGQRTTLVTETGEIVIAAERHW